MDRLEAGPHSEIVLRKAIRYGPPLGRGSTCTVETTNGDQDGAVRRHIPSVEVRRARPTRELLCLG